MAKGETNPKELMDNLNPAKRKKKEEAAIKKARDDAMGQLADMQTM